MDYAERKGGCLCHYAIRDKKGEGNRGISNNLRFQESSLPPSHSFAYLPFHLLVHHKCSIQTSYDELLYSKLLFQTSGSLAATAVIYAKTLRIFPSSSWLLRNWARGLISM